MKRFLALAMLMTLVLGSLYAFGFAGQTSPAAKAKSACGCTGCECLGCNGEYCTCVDCGCDACGCQKAVATPTECVGCACAE